jgi:N-acetylneuraminic acid mutarotase
MPALRLGFAFVVAALVGCSSGGSRNGALGAGGLAGVSGAAAIDGGSGGAAPSVGGAGFAGTTSSAGMASSMGGMGAGASSDAGSSGRAISGGAGASAAGAAGAGAGDVGGNSSAGASGSGGGASLGTPKESALAKLPNARQEHAVVAAAGEIYVIGGYVSNTVSESVQAYDPSKNSWRDVADFPERLNHANAGAVDDKIYVAGYYTNGTQSTATTKVYQYDPGKDAWTAKSPLPTGTERAAGCVAVDGGFLYVFGGARGGASVDQATRYEVARDTWEELPDLPERREHCVAGAVSGVLYVAGGRADGITGVQPKTWAYDPSAKTWTEKAALQPPRGGLAGAALGGRLFVFGGEGNSAVSSGVFPDIDAYDPATDSWQELAPMLVPRHGNGAAVLDGRIYLPGGATRQGAGATNENSVLAFP